MFKIGYLLFSDKKDVFYCRLLHEHGTQRSLMNTKEQNYVQRDNSMNSGKEQVLMKPH